MDIYHVHVAGNSERIETALTRLSEAGFRATAGAAARTFVESRLGGAARNAELIVPHLERG